MEIFAFCVINFEPSISKTCSVPKNDRQNLSFVKEEHTYGKKMARKGCTKVIHKGTFISDRSLCLLNTHSNCSIVVCNYLSSTYSSIEFSMTMFSNL